MSTSVCQAVTLLHTQAHTLYLSMCMCSCCCWQFCNQLKRAQKYAIAGNNIHKKAWKRNNNATRGTGSALCICCINVRAQLMTYEMSSIAAAAAATAAPAAAAAVAIVACCSCSAASWRHLQPLFNISACTLAYLLCFPPPCGAHQKIKT